MKRTSLTTLVILAAIGAIGAALLQAALASAGRPIVVIPFTLPVAVAAIGAIVVMMALPIRRTTRPLPDRTAAIGTIPAEERGPVDPFYATRVVALAKACALSGALVTGVGLGMLLYVLTRSGSPPVGSIAAAAAALIGAAVLLVCGLVAESMCRVPPGDDDDDDDGTPPRAGS